MAAKVKRCARCDRRLRGAGLEWGVELDFGEDGLADPAGVLCPECQTADEQTRRVTNDRENDYVWHGERVAMWPKAMSN